MKLKLFLILLTTTLATGQQEASVWYFGQNAGVKFDAVGNVTALTDGQLDTSEGCASIADTNGNLLFYTDGVTVWNKNHAVMPNGTGLMGDYSSTQSATIVPLPGSINLYYVFTLDAFVGIDGFRYSVVDMNLDGGNGGVIPTQKNILIYTPSDEKLAIVKHANNIDFWVVTHGWNSNSFYSYRLTPSGLNTTPVISNAGTVISGSTDSVWGYMKISPNGSKLAMAHSIINSELFDFNINTGVVSNPLILSTAYTYGVEFSSNSELLYITAQYSGSSHVLQFDMNASNILSSMQVVLDNNSIGIAALQLGPNNKIYIAQSGGKLGVINNPNIYGIGCNTQLDAVDLLGRTCQLGLPPFITSYFNSAFTATNLCLGSNTNFSLNSSQPITSILWDFGDGTATSTASSPTHTYATAGTYTVSVNVTTTAGVQPPTSKSITISAVPVVASAVANQTICGSASATYNLASHNATLLGGQSAATYGVDYFATATDLSNHSNALATAYALPLGVTTIYAKVYNLANTACYAQSSFTITKYDQPVANTITDFVYCQTPFSGTHQFDLSTKNSEVLGIQSTTAFTVSYHPTQTAANNNTGALPTLYTNSLPTEPIYARIQNNSHPACYDTKLFYIKVVSQPSISTVTDYKTCDDASNDGIALFDLSTKTAEILNGQAASTFVVKYFSDNANAVANTNAITAPINSTSTNVFYSIEALGNSSCRVISSFNLQVNPLPKANTPTNLHYCDYNNDGKEIFNLSSQTYNILGSQSAANFTVSYHFSMPDALANNPLTNNYQNTSNPQTIYARVTSIQNPACFNTTFFTIDLYKMPTAAQPTDIITCDDASNDGKESFNLTSKNAAVLGAQNPADFSVSYHFSPTEANSGANPLPATYVNAKAWQQTIYVRVVNNLSATCFNATKQFNLVVQPRPQLVMDSKYYICENTYKDIDAPLGFSTYEWSDGSSVIGTQPSIRISTAGNYSLKVTKNHGNIICDDTKMITLSNSNRAKITKIDIKDWTENENTIEVFATGSGEYEYSLDNHTFQDRPIFTGLGTGQYTVYVNDKRKCGTATKDVYLLIYPKFFSPNNDGANDFWKIPFSEKEPNLTVKIFDRFGNLIKELRKNNYWNGTDSNNNPINADDYWFLITRQDGTIYKGHFALVR
jgi:gliding motility-associated-like protein